MQLKNQYHLRMRFQPSHCTHVSAILGLGGGEKFRLQESMSNEVQFVITYCLQLILILLVIPMLYVFFYDETFRHPSLEHPS